MTPVALTTVDADRVVFRLADPEGRLVGVRLWCEVPVAGRDFVRVRHGWELEVPLPTAHRVEYLFEVTTGADTASIVDPGNPLRVAGVFGDHSWLPMPGYREPAWLDAPRATSERVPVEFTTSVGPVTGSLWAPQATAPTEQLPLLISHDGSQMDQFGDLTGYLAAAIEAATLPHCRVLLLDPGPRDERYGANPAYSAALVREVLPRIVDAAATLGRPVLMGQSLGALAALHAARRFPGTFGGLFLQSGSFFTPTLDPQESHFSRFAEVTGFVSTLYSTPPPEDVPISIVCGTAEENLANNRALTVRLRAFGADVAWGEVADGHTWTTWRDLLDPHLADLLHRAF
jgi:enterochelin esterase family protein